MTRFLKSSYKAGNNDHSHSGERALPKIPHHGPAAQLSQRVLLSKIEMKSAGYTYHQKEVEQPQHKQHTLPERAKGVDSNKEQSLVQKLRTMLYQKDHQQKPPKLDSVLTAGCQSQMAIPEDTVHEELGSLSDSKMLYQTSAASLMSSASNLLKRVASHASVQNSEFGASSTKGPGSPKSATASQGSVKKGRKGDSIMTGSNKSLPRLAGTQDIAAEMAASTAFTGPSKSAKTMRPRQGDSESSMKRSSISMPYRAERLRKCFDRSFEEIGNQITDLEHQGIEEEQKGASDQDNEESHAGSAFAALQKKAQPGHAKPAGEKEAHKKPPPFWLKDFVSSFEKSTIALVPTKPIPGVKEGGKDGQTEGPPTSAREAELAKCVAVLNFYRWLCRLPDVKLEEGCTRACDTVTQILIPRQPVFLKPAAQQYKQINELGPLAKKFVAEDGNICLLHSESSLIQGIGLAITSAHTVSTEEVGRYPSIPSSKRLQEVQESASKSKEVVNPDFIVQEVGAMNLLLQQKVRVSLDNFPKALEPLRFLWEFAAMEKRLQMDGKQSQQSPRSGVLPQSPGSGLTASPSRSNRRDGPVTRKIPWCGGRPLRDIGLPIEQGVFWGDRENSIGFRRYLLNPRLKLFGAHRRLDTCAFFIGEFSDETLQDIEDENAGIQLAEWEKAEKIASMPPTNSHENEMDVVCFPPPGIVPLNFMYDQVPTWSIMPNCRYYQPCTSLRVELFRVRIKGDQAERVEEIPTFNLSTDCSAKGNPFCIIFRPALARIVDGDEFEVVVSGLRVQPSVKPDLIFFHRFQDFRASEVDAQLVGAINRYRNFLDDMIFWEGPPGKEGQNGDKTTSKGKDGNMSSPKPEEQNQIEKRGGGAGNRGSTDEKAPEIIQVSHLQKTFHSDKVDVVISLYCPDVACMRCHLFLIRVNSKEEIQRCAIVTKISEYFIVRVKLPMAHCKWELSFKVSNYKNPEVLIESPFKYIITSAETCQNLLISAEHALKEKFGFVQMQIIAQIYGVTILAPTTHRVRSGHAYFLIHFDHNNRNLPPIPQVPPGDAQPHPTTTLLFSDRLAPPKVNEKIRRTNRDSLRGSMSMIEDDKLATASTLRSLVRTQANNQAPQPAGGTSERKSRTSMLSTSGQETCCAIGALHETLGDPELGIEPFVQDCSGSYHLDLSMSDGRYMQRLRQRPDFPELYEGTFQLDESEAGAKIELFLRCPKGHASTYTPLKIAEWLIIRRKEHFPMGF